MTTNTTGNNIRKADTNGREYLKHDAAVAGMMVELDTGFTCTEAKIVELKANPDGELYFDCASGQHAIEGQDDGDGYLIGIYPVN